MSEQDSSDAQPPQPSQPPSPPAVRVAANSKPKWLSAITVMAMVLGSLFGCCGLASVGGALANRAMTPAMMQLSADPTGQNPDFVAAQRRIMERNAALQARIFPFVITSGLLTLLHSLALVFAGIMAHNGRASGRRLLVVVCMVGLGVEAISGSFGLYHANEQGKVSEELMKAAMVQPMAGREPTPEQKEAQKMMQSFAAGAGRASSVLGLLMVIVFFATKVSYYVFSAIYLRRPDVVRHFEPQRPPAADSRFDTCS